MQYTAPFPPPLPTKEEIEKIAFSFCEATKDVQIEEIECAICGMLVCKTKALDLVASGVDFNLLTHPRSQATCQERKLPTDQISDKPGPIINPNCSHICQDCCELLKKRKIPLLSLVNGNWIEEVPEVFVNWGYTEKLLIARVRPNYCVVRVKAGMHKMQANTVLVPNPTAKIRSCLLTEKIWMK
ncbi:hypothetical protein K439DRAFT_1359990 [Ramaria rubella]|nr:hypothetical protein K439DRAFT_1359990 [Ramaria rubella]